MNLGYWRCHYGWKDPHMSEPVPDVENAPVLPPYDESPDGFEDPSDLDPDPELHEDAGDDFADVYANPGEDSSEDLADNVNVDGES
jgi:hypothetical protein